MKHWLTRGVSLAWIIGVAVMALPPRPPLAAAPAVTAEDAAAKAAYDSLPEADRRAIQDALIWTGDYMGIISGSFGPRTSDAIAAYAKRLGLSSAEALAAEPRARLLKQAQALRQAVGFTIVKDKRAGVSIGLPMKLLPKETGTDSGSRYSSIDGSLVVDTLTRPAGADGLGTIFDRMSANAGQRKVTYKLSRPDFFVVSGEIGDRKFYSRYATGTVGDDTLVRGFTLTYAKTAADRMDAVALAVVAGFDPFPAAGAPASIVSGAPAAQVAVTAPKSVGALPAVEVDAVLVAPDLAVASLSARTCTDPSVGGGKATYRVQDDATGLALLTVARTERQPIMLAAGPIPSGASLYAVFHADAAPRGKGGPLFVAEAVAQTGNADGTGGLMISAPLQGRTAGTPVVDRAGSLVGLTQPLRASPLLVAGTMLQADYRVTDAGQIKALLDRAGIAPQTPAAAGRAASLGDMVAALGRSIIRVTCAPPAP